MQRDKREGEIKKIAKTSARSPSIMKRSTSDIHDLNIHDSGGVADISHKNDLASGSECDGNGSPGLTDNGAID